MMKVKIGLLLLFTIFYVFSMAQRDSVQYKSGFQFENGIYLSFKEFKSNSPSIKTYSIIAESGKQIFEANDTERVRNINYFNFSGNKKSLPIGNFWGASVDGQPYAFGAGKFNKLEKVGAIIYLVVHSKEDVIEGYYDNLGQYGEKSVGSENMDYEFFIDFRTGKGYKYQLNNFLLLLESDEELYIEFSKLKKRAIKEYQMLNYIDKFNEKNSIKFPVNPFYQFE